MPPRLPYPPDDDDQALHHITHEINNPDPARWRAMITDDRILQTYRALVTLENDINLEFGRRNAELDQARAAYLARKLTATQRGDAVNAHSDWKKTALAFRARVQQRRYSLVHRVRQLHGDIAFDHIRKTLLTLAQAVADHRNTVTADRTPTPADRALWGRLTTLELPLGRPVPGEPVLCTSLDAALAAHENDPA